jgi:hypothetical protein
MFKIGDIISNLYDKEYIVTVEEVDEDGWFWSKDLLLYKYILNNKDIKNFHNPIHWELRRDLIRNSILNELLNEV